MKICLWVFLFMLVLLALISVLQTKCNVRKCKKIAAFQIANRKFSCRFRRKLPESRETFSQRFLLWGAEQKSRRFLHFPNLLRRGRGIRTGPLAS